MEFLTLTELNRLVGDKFLSSFPETYWIVAETSDVRPNATGHCYLEFIEKNPLTASLQAKARGYIWNSTFRLLNPYFESKTGRKFTSGIKVLVRVGVEFHPLYGYGLNVYDIDPTYTLGDLQAQRQEILRQLEEEGVLDLNKELELSPLPQRIAIITSPTAAGYEDFLDHLLKNNSGFVFYPRLFPAVMQGEQTCESVIMALERIYEYRDNFDAVIIIRGGGATSDLSAFDSYLLANHCAQFPLPVITGIGHERDDTVLDFVAFYRAKTPTAVADFLVEVLQESYSRLLDLQDRICLRSGELIQKASMGLNNLLFCLKSGSLNAIQNRMNSLEMLCLRMQTASREFLTSSLLKLNEKESFLKLSSPQYILSKGYSITMKNGKAVKSAGELLPGDELETRLADGTIRSRVED